jgi:hypothetical protein
VKPHKQEILDIDDKFCAAHGAQQLSVLERASRRARLCLDAHHLAASGTPVATILRPARTPKGTEVRTVIKHVTKRLRKHWPNTRMMWRADSHYGRVEAMEWAEDNGADYIFGLTAQPPIRCGSCSTPRRSGLCMACAPRSHRRARLPVPSSQQSESA